MQGLSLFTRFVLAALSLATFLIAAQFPLYTPGTDLEAVEYGVDYIIVEGLFLNSAKLTPRAAWYRRW